jgi:TonB-dependent starch-binding outer membrane protein SusC
MKLEKLFIIIFTIMSSNLFYGQTLKGKVTADGQPLPGVTIKVKGTNLSTNADFDGTFKFSNVAPNSVIEFSFLGFATKQVVTDGVTELIVSMNEEKKSLDEVVVVGYGTSRKKDLTGSISSIKASELKDQPFTSIDQALIGKAAGVNVTQNSGAPGGGVSIKIRGITSINGNEPLYVIDGTPLFADRNNEGFAFGSISGGNGQTRNSALSNINTADIESIDILKDASATAIYGANGSNGVILITTKKGKKGKSTIAYDTYLGVQEAAKFVEVLNLRDYAKYRNEISAFQSGNTNSGPYQFSNPDALGEGTNWQKEIFRSAFISNNTLSMSGEKNDTRYYTSLSYLNQEGIILNTDFDRYSLRLNVDSKVKEWLKIGNNIAFSSSKQHVVLNDDRAGIVFTALRQSPEVPVFNSNGEFGGPTANAGTTVNEAGNPVAQTKFLNNELIKYKINGNFFTDITLKKNLILRTELGYDFNVGKSSVFVPTYTTGLRTNAINISSKQQDQSLYYSFKNFLTYTRDFGNHSFNAMLGQEAQSSTFEYLQGSRTGFISNDFSNLSFGNIKSATNGNGSGRWSMASYFIRSNYNYMSKYYLTATLRADASSNFGPNNRWGYFPSVAGGWTISNENFMKNSSFFNFLKIRGGYGEVGNQNIEPFAYLETLTTIPDFNGGQAFVIDHLANPDVKWETLKSYNVGLELGILKDVIHLDVDLYEKRSSDFLFREPEIESTRGLPKRFINSGEIINKGIDLTLNTKNISKEKISWDTSLILSKFNNELTKYYAQDAEATIIQKVEPNGGGIAVTLTKLGLPVGQFYGFATDGLFRTEQDVINSPKPKGAKVGPNDTYIGDIKFKDINGDGVIDDNDKIVIGSPIPDFTGSLTNNFRYKNFDFALTLYGSYGNEIYNHTRTYTEGLNDLQANQSIAVLDRFVLGVNEDTNIPRFASPSANGNDRVSDRFIEDGSFLRIQNITFGYNLPSNFFNKSNFFSKIRAYGSIQNLYTFTKYSGLDPDLGADSQNVLLSGVDQGRYPVSRVVTFGVNLQF